MLLRRLSLLMVLMCSRPKSGQSALITFPRDTEVLVNHSTYFNCSTSILSEQIHWYHNRVGENRTNYVYYKGQFNQNYAERYFIEINTNTGEYNLIIRSVQPVDAGRYVCQDDAGLGELNSAELIVLESTPTCLSSMKPDGFVGPNSCDLPSEKLKFSCSVSYNGNIPPILQWKIDGIDTPISKGIATDYSGKRAAVNLTISSAIEMDGEFFTCGTTRSLDKKLSCTTYPAKINYAVGQPTILNVTKGETITCLANATVPCTYRWFYGNDTLCPASCSQNLTTHRFGNHSCEASCPINGINCTFVAIRIIVFEDEISTASEESTKALLIAIGLLVPTVVVLLITTCILFFKLTCITRKAKSENTELKNKTSVLIETNSQSSPGSVQQPAITTDDENNEPSYPNLKTSSDEEVERQSLLTAGDASIVITNSGETNSGETNSGEMNSGEMNSGEMNSGETNSKETLITTKATREMDSAISGIAALEDLIYVVCDNSKEVETIDTSTFEIKKRYKLEELVNPWDLTSCKVNECLYVMDRSLTTACASNHIVRIGTHVEPTFLGKWSTGKEYGNLSVTNDGNVIVTSCESGKLFVYEPSGTKIKDVLPLSVNLINPTHTLQLRNGQFLICHSPNKDNIHRVSILKRNGEIIKSNFEKMDALSYLAEDEARLIFVADQGNSRVIVLNSDMELIGEVASQQNRLRGPQRICLNVKAGKLLVADNEVLEFKRRDGKLLILPYDFNHNSLNNAVPY